MRTDIARAGLICALLIVGPMTVLTTSLSPIPREGGVLLALCVLLLSAGILVSAIIGRAARGQDMVRSPPRAPLGPRQAEALSGIRGGGGVRSAKVKERIVTWRMRRRKTVEDPMAKVTELVRYRTVMRLRQREVRADLHRFRHRFERERKDVRTMFA